MAGLYEIWRDDSLPEDDPHRWVWTCTIITTTPNELVAPVHDRMPVILERDDEIRWTDARVTDPAAVLPCLRPLPSSLMEGYPVSTLVSSPGNEGAQLVEPVAGAS